MQRNYRVSGATRQRDTTVFSESRGRKFAICVGAAMRCPWDRHFTAIWSWLQACVTNTLSQ